MDQRERLGLGISTAGHVLLLGALSLGLFQKSADLKPPSTIDVTFADAVALESLTREHAPDVPQTATAPEIGEVEPDAAPPPPSTAAPTSTAQPDPVAPPPPPRAQAPTPKPAPPPPPAPKPREQRASTRETPAAKPAPSRPARQEAPRQRASRLGDDFLKGIDAETASSRATPNTSGSNAKLSPVAARALNAEITRQIKPHWRPPSGADAEKLVTLLSVHLTPDGRIDGRVEVVGQEGVTASNRAQADLHAERAVQAVMRAAPFKNLPAEFYEQWKWLRPLRIYASL
ncbi:outer membrane biosynthesis protein TonB [Sphingobium sp. B1D7B]|uniref:TonB C-terminal domain-containing protein n=1 Tax=Sphingobium sp. B1D7B TaxID=2940578 RepID=UPI002225A197|nr:TonB C-terminal domain-containing protein [Sphingobium sp. B1D7B]MCW2404729.1 outer membrane biosynthesis protein TonB [Sphingobium sp. B1D7B]